MKYNLNILISLTVIIIIFLFIYKVSECVSKIPDNILIELCCNINDGKYMMNLYEKCKKINKILLPGCNIQNKISREQWEEINGFLTVAKIEGSVAQLMKEIGKQLP